MTSDRPTPWRLPPLADLPQPWVEQVALHLPENSRRFAAAVAQLLWQRGIQDPEQVGPFLNPNLYTPASPFAFGDAMAQACHRLALARDRAEKVAVWGDFDADGLTATALLWEGLGAIFPPERLTYVIPNRLTQSHGLNREGIDALAQQGYTLMVTCDTGSTHAEQVRYARDRGLDTIVTDHHTLPADDEGEPFPAVALINPRSLPAEHPLAALSGVAVAYKLIEAVYQHLNIPDSPEPLLDLVAIGLIADLVELRGDCRYLAQRGIEQLQQRQRPGLKHLIQQCQRSGDRPADISYGLGPRINAVSRIYGDASFCVELLTTRDEKRASYLAQQAELANQRRRSLQQRVLQDVESRLEALDDTTRVIVLDDPQWSVGILGLVAAQVAQRYGRPALLLQTPPHAQSVARGSARSVQGLDLYDLVRRHTHLLHQFGGHPYALGLSLPVENISMLKTALNRQTRVTVSARPRLAQADLTVAVQDLGPDLFQAFKPLEPFGMGHPIPKLLLQDVWFTDLWSPKQTDLRGQNTHYPRTTFKVCDESCPEGRPGLWWGHRKTDLPPGHCDALVELDFDSSRKEYRLRLVGLAARPATSLDPDSTLHPASEPSDKPSKLDKELGGWVPAGQYQRPTPRISPEAAWQQLIGMAKYLSRTGEACSASAIAERLGWGEKVLALGLETLEQVGFEVHFLPLNSIPHLRFASTKKKAPLGKQQAALYAFLASAHEEQFQDSYNTPSGATVLECAAHR